MRDTSARADAAANLDNLTEPVDPVLDDGSAVTVVLVTAVTVVPAKIEKRSKLPFHCEYRFTEEHGKTKRVRNFRARSYLPFVKSCGG